MFQLNFLIWVPRILGWLMTAECLFLFFRIFASVWIQINRNYLLIAWSLLWRDPHFERHGRRSSPCQSFSFSETYDILAPNVVQIWVIRVNANNMLIIGKCDRDVMLEMLTRCSRQWHRWSNHLCSSEYKYVRWRNGRLLPWQHHSRYLDTLQQSLADCIFTHGIEQIKYQLRFMAYR